MSAAGSGFEGLTKGLLRLKQKALTLFGAEETVDVQFNVEKAKLDAGFEQAKELVKSVSQFHKSLQATVAAQTRMQEKIHSMYVAESPMWAACLAQQKTCADMHGLAGQLEQQLNSMVLGPLAAFVQQHRMLLERCEERERRRLDMDRYRGELKSLTEKNGDFDKLAAARHKADTMAAAYQALNDELLRDIPRLLEDQQAFFDPLFAALVDVQQDFFARSSASLTALGASLRHVERQTGPRPHVITAPTSSAYILPINQTVPTTRTGVVAVPPPSHTAPHHSLVVPPPSQTAATITVPPPSQTAVSMTMPSLAERPTSALYPSTVAAPCRALALYDCVGEPPNELSFTAGDVISILRKDGEWWTGELNGKRGLVPSSYVSALQ